jgi:hypothetical protein
MIYKKGTQYTKGVLHKIIEGEGRDGAKMSLPPLNPNSKGTNSIHLRGKGGNIKVQLFEVN